MDSRVKVTTSCLTFKKYIETFEKNEGVKRRKMKGKTVKRNEKIEILIVKLLWCNKTVERNEFDCEATLMQ